jgi:hypothetical protein
MISVYLSLFLLGSSAIIRVESAKASLENYRLVRFYPANDLQKKAINSFEEIDSQVK